MDGVSDAELKRVIADFLDMGHVENIVSMFRREPGYYAWVGEILNDSRFQVRLGVAVLFEELQSLEPDRTDLATSSLLALLNARPALPSHVRGDAVGILGMIGSKRAMTGVRAMVDDPDPQVAAMARDILEEGA